MPLKLFNTWSRSLEAFTPLDPAGKKVGLYCCGPTVYDYAHIGNFRTFVFADLVRRYLEFRGYAVRHVMNITDVDDKIIKKVRELGVALADGTAPFERAFFEDFDALGCLRPHDLPHATANIPGMISLIQKLLDRGLAYRAADGSVYFSIENYQRTGAQYGQLVKLNFDALRVGERVRSDEYAKEAWADFALWKARIPEDGQVFWPSPWGEGRPGWHIECSAMSMDLLGPSFDLHLGGEDLAFPHHEDEIAQSEGAGLQAPGRRFVKYWLHGAHLLVEGKKMSKSLGNFYTVRDLLGRGYAGREIRYLLLTTHYRESANFTLEGLAGARTALGRIDECQAKLQERTGPCSPQPDPAFLSGFIAAMDDDLNISAAWAAVFDWVRDLNRRLGDPGFKAEAAASALAAWRQIDAVLGVGNRTVTEIPEAIQALAAERQAARAARDFKRADALREALKTQGWAVEDTPQGPKVKRLANP
jgi:cysteinyl-tRNA synthetase